MDRNKENRLYSKIAECSALTKRLPRKAGVIVPSRCLSSVRALVPLIFVGLLAVSSSVLAQKLSPVKLRIAGSEVTLKTSALTDGSETYAPLEVLGTVGALGKVNKKGDTVNVSLPALKKDKEIALARLDGKPMLPLSELAKMLDASVTRPNELGEDGKPLPDKPGDTVYVLARIQAVKFENGTLKIVTSFPVPYKINMVTLTKPFRGYIDCLGAKVDETVKITPLPEAEKRALKLRAGQNTPEIARVVLELTDGNVFKAVEMPLNTSETIAATLIKGAATAPNGTVVKTKPATPSIKPPVKVTDTKVLPSKNPNDSTKPTTKPDKSIVTDTTQTPENTDGTANPETPTVPKTTPVITKPNSKPTTPTKKPAPLISVSKVVVNTDSDELLKIQVSTSGRARSFVRYERDASQLVIDFPNARLALEMGQDLDRKLGHPLLSGLRMETIEDIEPLTRITLEIPRIVGFTANAFDKSFTLELRKPRESGGRLAEKLIVIDPGHGGNSSGATGGGILEKHLCLAIALKLRTALEALGAKVVMTRDKDSSVALYDRPRLANDIGADLFISIHNDSTARPGSASGTSTYYHMGDPSSRALAVCIQQAICGCSGLPNRGALSDGVLYQSGLAVLRASSMPAVLTEVAYINNNRDRAKLTDPAFQKAVADAMMRGIRKYVENTPISEPTKSEGDTATEEEMPPSAEEPK